MQTNCRRVRHEHAGLLVVDIQERLLPAIWERERVVANSVHLITGAGILRLPIFATEQYKKGLGPTVPEVVSAVPNWSPFEKVAFSACGAAGLTDALKGANISDVVVCGIETHVCVTQTCLDLLDAALGVFIVADSCSSRTPDNHRFGLERMRDSGAAIVSTEMVLFELLQKASTEDFKRVLGLVK